MTFVAVLVLTIVVTALCFLIGALVGQAIAKWGSSL